ncbi:MAG TPA: 50S ribosomal protein L10 [Fibrobacteres bacterium]|jgi:large subunit ribosomal protein L10|nr:50S ribosomal protein L10 [Fibrobacterota bacterium]
MSTRTERTQTIDTLEKAFNSASGIYLTDINRISVEKISRLRVNFRKKDIRYVVVKNTLAKIACERCGKKDLVPYLKGSVGIALANNESMAPAKIIKDFQKENKDLLAVKIASVDGTVFSGTDALKLADIPPREVLLAQLLGCLQAPVANMAGALNAVLVKFAGTLEGLKNLKESDAK